MEFLKIFIIVIQILSGFGIVGLVLLQQGKGADMGAAFGSGSAGGIFGSRGTANFLSHTTAIFAVFFFISTLSLTLLNSGKFKQSAGLLELAAAKQTAPPDANNKSDKKISNKNSVTNNKTVVPQ